MRQIFKLMIFTLITAFLLTSNASADPKKWKPMWQDFIEAGNTRPLDDKLIFSDLGTRGVKVIEDFEGTPDKNGILKRYELDLGKFERGVYFSGDAHPGVAWPDGANRVQPWIFDSIEEICSDDYVRRESNYERIREGMFLMLKTSDGGYLVILPMCGEKTLSWLYTSKDSKIILNIGTLGKKPVSGNIPLVAWYYSKDIYNACRKVWLMAISHETMKGRCDLRMNKKYPEIFEYLGWCSWEEYKWDISEDMLVETVKQIENSDIPVRFLLVDDGHLDRTDKKLRSFFPDQQKFPRGWSKLLSMRKEDKIKWMGQWNTVSGYWYTIAKDNSFGKIIKDNLTENLWLDALVPANDRKSCELFYKAHLQSIKAHGFDFVKVDNQSRNICWYMGSDNAVEAAVNNQLGLEEAVRQYSGGIINCMAHGLPCIFNTKHSAVTRSSIDYKAGKEARGKSHLLQSYSNTLWIGQTVWGDHDMFHSSDKFAGRVMAISKAMSGAPVYLSDSPKDFIDDYIKPLCYQDGKLLRPTAPACPLPDSIFIAPMREKKPYRVIAPYANGSVSIVAHNLYHPTDDIPMKANVSVEDYQWGNCMVQPFEDKWEPPMEGLVYYDWHLGKGGTLKDKYEFELTGFEEKLVHLSPIIMGWAAIGRSDKYLSPAPVEVVFCMDSAMKIKLAESGPIVIYSSRSVPKCEGVNFTDIGGGMYAGDIPVGNKNIELLIER
jgi:hypothetical protein